MTGRWLNADQVAEILGISRASAYRVMRLMPHVVLGEKILRISEKVLDRYLHARTETPWVTGSTKKNQAAHGTAFFTTRREGVTNDVRSAETVELRDMRSMNLNEPRVLRKVYPKRKSPLPR